MYTYIQKKYHISAPGKISAPEKKKCRLFRTNRRRNNDIEIIIRGDDGADIAAELRSALQKIRRKRELSCYMIIRK